MKNEELERQKAIYNGYKQIYEGFSNIYRSYRRNGFEEEALIFEKIADGFKDVCSKYEVMFNGKIK